MVAADAGLPFLDDMIQECADAPDCDAWIGWTDSTELSVYIQCFMYAAQTDRNWSRASAEYAGMWEARQERLRQAAIP